MIKKRCAPGSRRTGDYAGRKTNPGGGPIGVPPPGGEGRMAAGRRAALAMTGRKLFASKEKTRAGGVPRPGSCFVSNEPHWSLGTWAAWRTEARMVSRSMPAPAETAATMAPSTTGPSASFTGMSPS